MIDRIKKYLAKAKRIHYQSDGFLTKTDAMWNYKEIHAFGIGIIDGILEPGADHKKRLKKWREVHDDVDDQPHYFTKGFFIGRKIYFIGAIFLVMVLGFLAFWMHNKA